MGTMTTDRLREIIKAVSPNKFNSIIIDNASKISCHNYCYIKAFSQRVEFHTSSRSAYVDNTVAQRILEIKNNEATADKPYYRLDDRSLIETFDSLPKAGSESLMESTKKKVNELINGGREVDHNIIILNRNKDRIALQQPVFIVKEECDITTSDDGTKIGTLTYFQPIVKEDETVLIRCKEGDIEGLKESVIESRKGDDSVLVRMVTHFNGIDKENYDKEIVPYLELIHDKIGDDNALEEYYHRVVSCYTFSYKDILTGENRTGVLVDPYQTPEVILNLENNGTRIINGIHNHIKGISRFLGSIGKTGKYKEKSDLMRATRLLISTAVADGVVTEEEKQALTLAIRNINDLTDNDREELFTLLGEKGTPFLTDEDYLFYNPDNARETLESLQEIAASDGEVSDSERDIMERLRLAINDK